jgi:hypothetical protein
MRTTAYFGLAALLMLCLVAPAVAQEQESADLKAYRVIFDATAPDKKAELSEVFLAEAAPAFIESQWRDNVYVILLQSYRGLENWNKLLDAIDRLEKLVPKTPPERRKLIYAEAMNVAAGKLKDTKKTVFYAEKILAIDPKDTSSLLTLAVAIPDNAQESDLNKVIDYGKRLLDQPKPEAWTDGQWQEIRTSIQVQNQSLIAMMVLNKKDYINCVKEYDKLSQLSPKDPAAHYRSGFCQYVQVRSANEAAVAANKALITFIEQCNEGRTCESDEANAAKIKELTARQDELKKVYAELREKAIESFAKAVAIGGAAQEVQAARTELEKLFKAKNSESDPPIPGLDGLDNLIAQKKKELGV